MGLLGWSGAVEQQKPSSTPVVQICGAALPIPLQKIEYVPFGTAPTLGKTLGKLELGVGAVLNRAHWNGGSICVCPDFMDQFKGHVALSTVNKVSFQVRLCLVHFKLVKIPSYQMFRHMHEALNMDEKKTIAQFTCKLRDKSFKPNYAMI